MSPGKGSGVTAHTRTMATTTARTVSAARPRAAVWATYAACACALVYAAMKLYYASGGRLGLPGGPPVSDAAYDQYDHVVLRQLGLVAVDLLAAGIAVATVQPWGRFLPRWLMLAALGVGFLALAAGATAVLQNTFLGAGPLRWSNVALSAFVVTWVVLWVVTACYYFRGARGSSRIGRPSDRLG
jgi:hypothetical protein